MPDASSDFLTFAIQQFQKIQNESNAAIHQAAQAVADALADNHLLYLFGSAHSGLAAKEAHGRAGGLVPAIFIEDVMDGDAERVEGMARIMLGRYGLEAGDVLIVISNSGINAIPIEMVQIAREKGVTSVAITSIAHSSRVPLRHSSGQRLYDAADIVIDTHSPYGDTVLPVPGSEFRAGSTSSIASIAIVQAIVVQTIALLSERGMVPPFFVSANVPEGKDHNHAMMAKYQKRLARYQIPLTWEEEKK
ncbi:MAG: SIS domain-containing protein [Anaerolineaceae bacterium]|nr:SIS domain-containing protein [Anaerolineaceae bacterium]